PWPHMHSARFLSPPGSAAVRVLRDRHRRSVPQLLELPVQQQRMVSELLAVPQEFRARRRLSLRGWVRRDDVAARRLLLQGAISAIWAPRHLRSDSRGRFAAILLKPTHPNGASPPPSPPTRPAP